MENEKCLIIFPRVWQLIEIKMSAQNRVIILHADNNSNNVNLCYIKL